MNVEQIENNIQDTSNTAVVWSKRFSVKVMEETVEMVEEAEVTS